MAVAALVLGILGTMSSLVIVLFWLGIPLGVIALILGIVARKNAMESQQPTGLATAGLVLGIVSLVLGLLVYGLCAAAFHTARNEINRAANDPVVQQKLQQQREFDEAFKNAVKQHAEEQQNQPGAPATPSTPATPAPGPATAPSPHAAPAPQPKR